MITAASSPPPRRAAQSGRLHWPRNFSAAFSFPGLVAGLFFNVVFFQIHVLAQAAWLYPVLRVLFFALVIQAAGVVGRACLKDRQVAVWLILLVLVRVPFYWHSSGLVVSSDNSVEALQSADMQKTHRSPYFRHEVIRHQGTIKYLWVAFLWDVLGQNYLWIVLLQLVLYAAVLACLYAWLKNRFDRSVLRLLLLTQFAFVEILFDYSLYLRGAPYLEMLFFFFLGLAVFEARGASRVRMFLAFYFIFFSFYIHPSVVTFLSAFAVYGLASVPRNLKSWLKTAGIGLAGLGAGLAHWFYYLAFVVKPPIADAEQFAIISKSGLSWPLVPAFLKTFGAAFRNLFSYEFSFLQEFFGARPGRAILSGLNTAAFYLSLAVFAAAVVLVLARVFRGLWKKMPIVPADIPYLFFLVLLLSCAFKLAAVVPPHTEPRHNFDLVFVIVLSYIFVGQSLLKIRRLFSIPAATAVLLLSFLTVPHYVNYFRQTVRKERTYGELLGVLRANRVKYLTTDFIIAYNIYFLSKETILVSDEMGPYSLKLVYRHMARAVEKRPPTEKAYLFFSDTYYSRSWHRAATAALEARVLKQLDAAGIGVQAIRMEDYLLFIPRMRPPAPPK